MTRTEPRYADTLYTDATNYISWSQKVVGFLAALTGRTLRHSHSALLTVKQQTGPKQR
jgi:hypothetical protein